MTNFHTRASIGLRSANTSHLTLRTPNQIGQNFGATIHHTGYGGTLFHLDPIARLRGIQAYHMDTLGYGDIAYGAAWDADGNVYALRDGKYVGAHALGTRRGGSIPNQLTDGWVYLEDARGWTQAAAVALHAMNDLYVLSHGRLPHFFGHLWWSITSCPGPPPYLIDVVRYIGGSA